MTAEKDKLGVSSTNVAISHTHKVEYCGLPPFHPSQSYPEYPFKGKEYLSKESNGAYDAIRQVMFLVGLDSSNYGNALWNPLGDLIKPGNQVLIKPNLVYNSVNNDMDAKLTHGSVTRAVLDYVCIALKGRGTIIVGDSPIQGADFDELVESTGLNSIVQFFRRLSGLEVEIVDFRTKKVLQDKDGVIVDSIILPGDPAKYTKVNLGDKSLFKKVESLADRFRVTMYDKREMFKHHSGGLHEYLIPNTVLNSDLIISLPKLKTHRIAGLTGSLKSMIGLNGRKDWLPHYCKGSLSGGGDQYKNRSLRKWFIAELSEWIDASNSIVMRKRLTRLRQKVHCRRYRYPYKDPALWGEWYGNDTVWRTILDVFRIILYADNNGNLSRSRPRKFLTIVDGIISGEGEGPLSPVAKKTGWIIGSLEPVAVDLVCSLLMGFDYRKIPQVKNAVSCSDLGLFPGSVDDIKLLMWPDKKLSLNHISNISNRFLVPESWQGYL